MIKARQKPVRAPGFPETIPRIASKPSIKKTRLSMPQKAIQSRLPENTKKSAAEQARASRLQCEGHPWLGIIKKAKSANRTAERMRAPMARTLTAASGWKNGSKHRIRKTQSGLLVPRLGSPALKHQPRPWAR